MASASCSVSVVTAPCPCRTGPNPPLPALTMMMLDPALRICRSIDVRAPVPIATMTMTAATPMIMPRAVSAVRIALRRSALTATTNVMKKDIALCRLRYGPLQVDGGVPSRTHGPIRAHLAIAKRHDARAVFRDVGFVGDEHDRQAAFGV